MADILGKTDERFWSKVDRSRGPMGCWLWTASTGTWGYGRLGRRHDGRLRMFDAHRYAWMLTIGDPGDLCVLHRCDVRACCNPAHLFLGTKKDNALDMHAKGRAVVSRVRGERNGNAKLVAADVEAVRRTLTGRRGELAAIARNFNVDTSTIWKIARGRTWAGGQ